jgi:hypothetical protein
MLAKQTFTNKTTFQIISSNNLQELATTNPTDIRCCRPGQSNLFWILDLHTPLKQSYTPAEAAPSTAVEPQRRTDALMSIWQPRGAVTLFRAAINYIIATIYQK